MAEKFWMQILCSLFCTCTGIGFLYCSYGFLWLSAYDGYLVLGFLICLIFGITTIFGVAVSWVKKIIWMSSVYGWSSSALFFLILVAFIIRSLADGLDLETVTMVTIYGIGLYVNWQAMRKLHHVVI